MSVNLMTIKNRSKTKFYKNFFLIFLFLIIFFQIYFRIVNSFIDYDEGFNLQVSTNLRKNFSYSSFEEKFDSRITTGPTVLIPASVFINQNFPFLPRVVMLFFSLALSIFCTKKIFQTYSQKILYLTCLNIIPLYFFFSSHVLGELPGFFFLILSFYFTSKKIFLSGMLFGLAFLTKNVYIIALLPLILTNFVNLKKIKIKNSIKKTKKINMITISIFFKKNFLFLCGFLMILILFEFYKVLSLDLNLTKYLSLFIKSTIYNKSQALPHISMVSGRLEMIQYTLRIDGIFFLFVTLYISLYAYLYTKWRFFKTLSLFYIVHTFYFVFFARTILYRHFFPSILSLALIAPFFLNLYFKNLDKKKIILIISFLLIFIINFFREININQDEIFVRKVTEQNLLFLNEGIFAPKQKTPLLVSQLDTAKFINSNIPRAERLSGIGWWNAPEIAYLTNRKIDRNPMDNNNKYLISHIYGKVIQPYVVNIIETMERKKTLFIKDGYQIYQKL